MLASSLYAKIVSSRASDEKTDDQEDGEASEDGSGTASDAPGSGTVTPNGRKGNGARAATSMAGGRRRKAVRKK